MKAPHILILILIITIILTGCDNGKQMRTQQLTVYKNNFEDNNRQTNFAYERFSETLNTKKVSYIGGFRSNHQLPDEILSNDEYIATLEREVKDFSSEYTQFNIVADEYYKYLTDNQEKLINDGENVAQQKINIQQSRAKYQEKKEEMTAALNNLIEKQAAQKEAIQNIIKLLISLA